jgi:L-2-hydroxyglutarate oxidase LhgO
MKTEHDFECDVIVIGAGVIGLAVARELQLQGREVILLEKNEAFGMETSSRNSEVIHAGIYYPAGSLKALHCVQGKQLLYAYAKERNIPHQQIGKLIVATQEDELNKLDGYIEAARINGVNDLRRISQAELKELEPHVQAFGAVISPSTGIIDSHALMLSLLGDFENAGGNFIPNSPVESGRAVSSGIQIQLNDADQSLILAKTVINAAGLHACAVARSIEGILPETIPQEYYAIGHYFTMGGKSPFKHLIYPVAGHGYLGVHVTLDMGGQVRFGPDIEWIHGVDYAFDESRKQRFIEAVARYYPEVTAKDVSPAYTGIRPKISGPKDPSADFLIQTEAQHGVPGLINLLGMESPGLTSCLSIAAFVAQLKA